MLKIAFHTLGCKVNSYETEAIWSLFAKKGYQRVPFSELADVYVIQTCTVTNMGDQKSRQSIRKAIRTNPAAVVAVTGCYSQTSPQEVAAIPGVDIVVGTQGRERLVELVEKVRGTRGQIVEVGNIRKQRSLEALPVPTFSGKTRAFLKIQDGCDLCCTYCIIPWAKGPSRSQAPERVVAEARELVDQGYREIVLTGIHTGGYGDDLQDYGLFDLLRDLSALRGLARLRVSSIEMNQVTPRIIDMLKGNRIFCRHLHIPVQSGHDDILRRMRRRYTVTAYRKKIEDLYVAIPGLALTTDVIVGFPGETDEHFEDTYRLLKDLSFTRLHVFPYSMRQKTPAARMDQQVDSMVKRERVQALLELSQELSLTYAKRCVGEVHTVIPEQRRKGEHLMGYTDTYLQVDFPAHSELVGRLCRVRIDRADAVCSTGTLVRVLEDDCGSRSLA
ncbi:tRNA (N(6)-L-threonylcarbamoyladenosine(37)-C(2))-methylthiotransferase MtaB [Pasteuria penetrans]|uniref:tRNA (N(6)-L-threonylcarbamoyladenosine(37)-C(2))- methylthiotransferase MtaB n=1 Tax=Pasteuria penetrans TaxID=86005 RepID=UPI000FB166FD|nr:tRNA (N(6)-L-threonylcarbamoyladenosine(37)-C(2))-methylthiotransferase MtaB [Pasteuria penetrans]